MSILVVQVVPQGLLFGADRNVTTQTTRSDTTGQVVTIVHGQTQRPKVLRWPNRKALVGYVGSGTIGKLPSDEWLYDYIGEHLDFADFATLAQDLSDRIEAQRRSDEGSGEPVPLILHLGGFEIRDGVYVPVVWHIRNAHGMAGDQYTDICKKFRCTEALWTYFSHVSPAEIRDRLAECAREIQPFWLHQGIALKTFNAIESSLQLAFRMLESHVPEHSFPQTIEEWERHLRLGILTYGAYYEAFHGPGEHYVGGGVDTVHLPWPESVSC